jgi:ubiquinone/menaquinone biosynthesis C-methylase UbiE
LGCGYGRVVFELLPYAKRIIGIDTSKNSLKLARKLKKEEDNCEFIEMDATNLSFKDNTFDVVLCVQNGINAFGVDKLKLVKEAHGVLKPDGIALFSSYIKQFWFPRLHWFELQAKHGLIGEIDYESTGNGTIVCKDGLRLDITDVNNFRVIGKQLDLLVLLTEVDESSLFCEFTKDI